MSMFSKKHLKKPIFVSSFICLLLSIGVGKSAFAENLAFEIAQNIEETAYPKPYERHENIIVNLYRLPALEMPSKYHLKDYRLLHQLVPRFGKKSWLVAQSTLPNAQVNNIDVFEITIAKPKLNITPFSIKKILSVPLNITNDTKIKAVKILNDGKLLSIGQSVFNQPDQLLIYQIADGKLIHQQSIPSSTANGILLDVEWIKARQQLAIVTGNPCSSYAFQCHGSIESQILLNSIGSPQATTIFENGNWNGQTWGGLSLRDDAALSIVHTKNEVTRFDTLMTQPDSMVWNWQTNQKVILQKTVMADPRNAYVNWKEFKFSKLDANKVFGLYTWWSAESRNLYEFSTQTGNVNVVHDVAPRSYQSFIHQQAEHVLGFYTDSSTLKNYIRVHQLNSSGKAKLIAEKPSNVNYEPNQHVELSTIETDKFSELKLSVVDNKLNIQVNGQRDEPKPQGFVLLQAQSSSYVDAKILTLKQGQYQFKMPTCSPKNPAWCYKVGITANYLGDENTPSAQSQILLNRVHLIKKFH